MNTTTELSTPATPEPAVAAKSWLGQGLAAVGVVGSLLYLSNLGFGWAEFPPDNVPLAGNIDEFLISLLLVYCLQKLGINLLPSMPGRRSG